MSPEERARVFQKFSRVVPKENYGGFGLGLWIVDQVVHAHGGSVEITSNKGEGATFTVILPTSANRPAAS
jgi:signal transduction histidine kinase